MAKKKNSSFFTSLLYIIIGVLLIVFRDQTLGWAMTAAGVFFVISGILDLLRRNVLGGVVSVIIGVAVLVLGWTVAHIVLLVLGILIAVKGIVSFLDAFKRSKKTLLSILFPIFTVVVGLMLAFGNALSIMILVAGILLVVDGVLGLFAR